MSTPNSRWWSTIDAFNERAAIILSSAIARRDDLATIGTQMKFIASVVDGRTNWRMDREVPPEAETESAFARVRPVFLENDPVFHGKVMKAISGLAQDYSSDQKTIIRPLRDAWRFFEKDYRWSLGIATEVAGLGGAMRTDRQIARDFLYGDLVHADADARQRLTGVSAEDRLIAAVVWVTDAIRLTEATRRLILDLEETGTLGPRPS